LVAFTIMGVAILVVDYASQLTFIQPALLLGETEGLSPWSQYSPHGIFIALENVGYLLLNLAFLLIGIAIVRMPTRLWRAAGWVFAGGGALTLVLLVFYSAFYRVRLDYRFEVTAIAITWLVLIVAPALLTIAFLRRNRSLTSSPDLLRAPDRDFIERYAVAGETVRSRARIRPVPHDPSTGSGGLRVACRSPRRRAAAAPPCGWRRTPPARCLMLLFDANSNESRQS
jgi:hypothetical protein